MYFTGSITKWSPEVYIRKTSIFDFCHVSFVTRLVTYYFAGWNFTVFSSRLLYYFKPEVMSLNRSSGTCICYACRLHAVLLYIPDNTLQTYTCSHPSKTLFAHLNFLSHLRCNSLLYTRRSYFVSRLRGLEFFIIHSATCDGLRSSVRFTGLTEFIVMFGTSAWFSPGFSCPFC